MKRWRTNVAVVLGALCLVPAVSLVSSGLSGAPVLRSLTQPLWVVAGIFTALFTNLPTSVRFRPRNAAVLLVAASLGVVVMLG